MAETFVRLCKSPVQVRVTCPLLPIIVIKMVTNLSMEVCAGFYMRHHWCYTFPFPRLLDQWFTRLSDCALLLFGWAGAQVRVLYLLV